MTDDAILALAYLTAFVMLLVVLGMLAEAAMMFMGARRRGGGDIFKMSEPAARGARPPDEITMSIGGRSITYSVAQAKARMDFLNRIIEENRMALSPAGPLAKDIAKCQKCGEEIVFLQSFNQRTKKRGRMPVNLRPTTPKFRPPNAGEIDFVYGQHEPHWGTCPEAEYFRGRSGRQER